MKDEDKQCHREAGLHPAEVVSILEAWHALTRAQSGAHLADGSVSFVPSRLYNLHTRDGIRVP